MKKNTLFFSSLFLFLFSQLQFAQTHTGVIEFTDASQISADNYPTGPIYALLEDADLNVNDGLAETVNVNIVSTTEDSSESYIEQFTLTETGVNTGIFFGQITADEGGTVGSDGLLQVNVGDYLIVTYNDAADDFGNPQSIVDGAVYGFTEIPGANYTVNTTWSLAESPYLISGDITVESGATLTVEPGVEVRFLADRDKLNEDGQSYLSINNNGILYAVGTETDSIKFTVQSQNPEPGQWGDISIFGQATVEHCIINYGNRIKIYYPELTTMKNNRINNCSGYNYPYVIISIEGDDNSEILFEQNKIEENSDVGKDVIKVYNTGVATEINNNTIEFMGNNNAGIIIENSNSKISGNYITGTANGIIVSDHNLPITTPQITNNTIEGTNTGILVSGNYIQPLINYNNLADNTEYGLYNEGDQEINAKSNWWGDAATAEMDGGGNPKNITYIYDQYDDGSKGFVNYAWWTNTVTIVETQEVTTGVNDITFEETSSTLSLNASTEGSVTMTYIDGQAEPGTLPSEANATSEYYWNAESNGVTFTDGAIGIPLDSLDSSVDLTTLTWLKRENPGDPWNNIGGTTSGNEFKSNIPFDSFSEFIIGSNSARVKLNVFLEGSYGTGGMNTELNSDGVLPFSQPYNTAPFDYTGTEKVGFSFYASNTDIVDWVLVELRTGDTPETSVTRARKAALVKSNGVVVDVTGSDELKFFGVPPGDYFIVVHHRNHLSIMSPTKVDMN